MVLIQSSETESITHIPSYNRGYGIGKKETAEKILNIILFMEKAYLTYDVVSLNDKEIKEIIDKIKKIGGLK